MLLLSACAQVPSAADRGVAAEQLARSRGFSGDSIHARHFVLQSYYRFAGNGVDDLTVYIEGDGYAWASRSQPSFDPTPVNPVALKMSLADTTANVAYLARPCQYLKAKNDQCNMLLWTHQRFSPEIIESMNAAVDSLKEKTGARQLRLVGFSGGGAVAALIAARRDDVAELVTVAGNLDPVFWAAFQQISPLEGSLNPADFSRQLAVIPQLHFVGGKDEVVPLAVAQSFRAAFADASKVRIEVVPEFTHHCCWAEEWPALQATYLKGGKGSAD